MKRNERRYSIVKVDNICPAYENINLCDEKNTTCKDCKVNENYGDTKKQLIQKVIQAIDIKLNEDNLITNQQLAKFIIEFLGVE